LVKTQFHTKLLKLYLDFTRFNRHIIMSELERRVKNAGHQIYSRV
jgi:hypothetical protein